MSRFSCEQKTRAKQQSVHGNQSNVDGLRQHGLIHQTPAAATAGHHARRACQGDPANNARRGLAITSTRSGREKLAHHRSTTKSSIRAREVARTGCTVMAVVARA
jgi:hypothetical protein